MMSAEQFTFTYLDHINQVVNRIDKKKIVEAISILFDAWKRGSTIFTCGNGGSASTATHLAADLGKFTRVKGAQPMKALSLCDNAALISALTNDLGFSSIFIEQLRAHFCPGDVLIVVSVHGGSGNDEAGPWSQNLLTAANYSKENQGKLISMTGFGGGALAPISDAAIIIPETDSGLLTTPLVESLHVTIHHLICDCLRSQIAALSSLEYESIPR